MSEPLQRAVFLSYAREDAEAAKRIAEALRGFGVEVWFDMDELRGGDAWDAKIRNQIRTCALFIPIVSAGTHAREEGYFRREWKLAVDRTHDMAEDRAFIVPVLIDDVGETSASVPEQFRKAHWTRLPGGEPTPQFVEQVKRLLQGPRATPSAAKPATRAATAVPNAATKSGFPVWAAVLLGVVVLALGAFVVFRPAPKVEVTPAVSAPVVPAPVAAVKPEEPAVPSAGEKSIAVLPFTNMSEDKDASAFFSDGIQEDILTNLALISELHVVSRTSVMEYRNTTKKIRQIGQELGVTYLLEGSVRRAGNKVRVTGQLINSHTDEHVWAKSYDRDLTDIFAIQAELSQEIASALKAVITPQQKNIIAGRATTNVEAYNNYLKARQIVLWSDVTRVTMPEIERLLQAAVQLDPNFLLAWLEIAKVNYLAYLTTSIGGDRNLLAKGQAALTQAIRLAPDDPAVIHTQGRTAETVGDLVTARVFYERALALAPGNAEFVISLGELASQERHWAEAMGYHRRAQALDPRNPVVLWDAYNALMSLRQFDEAARNARLLAELQPDSFDVAAALAIVPFAANGSRKEMEALFAHLTPEQQLDPKVVAAKFNWFYHEIGDAKAYVDLRDRQGTDNNFSDEDSTMQLAEALIVLGQRDRAIALVRPMLEQIKTRSAAEPDNMNIQSSLAYAHALAGDHDAALAVVNRILASVKPDSPFRKQFFLHANAAIVLAWIGEKDKAVDLFQPLMGVPAAITNGIESLHNDIDFSPLRGFPRWEAMLADPANHQPFKY
jgi:TolB-like protein/Flp pilus assembly protein TadD